MKLPVTTCGQSNMWPDITLYYTFQANSFVAFTGYQPWHTNFSSFLIASELSYCDACQCCKRHKLLSCHMDRGTHVSTPTDTHRNVWMFFPGSLCGLCIPHSFLALCVLGDLSKILCQTILTALWSQHCRHHHCSNTKHTQAHMNAHSINQVNCRAKPLRYATAMAQLSSLSLRGGLQCEWLQC